MRRRRDGDQPQGGATPSRSENGERPHWSGHDAGMHLDFEACRRAFLTRDPRFDGRIFGAVNHRHLLPADLPGADAEAGEHDLLPDGRGGPGGGLPALPALPAGELAGPRRLARHVNTVSRALALIEAGAMDGGDVDAARRAARRRRAAAAPAVPPAPRRLAGGGRADAARAARQAADPGDPPADGRGGAGVAASAACGGSTRPSSSCSAARRASCAAATARDPAADGSRHLRLPYSRPTTGPRSSASWRPRDPRRRDACEATRTPGPSARRRDGGDRGAVCACSTGPGRRDPVPGGRRCTGDDRRASAVFDLGADPPRSARTCPRTRRWRRWSPPGRACGRPAPGTASSSRCAASSASRSPSAPPAASRPNWSPAFGTRLSDMDEPAIADLTHAFPSPDQIMCADDLAATLGMPRERAAAIRALAEAALADPRLFEPGLGLDESIARLRSLAGIGEWTAQYIAMRACGNPTPFQPAISVCCAPWPQNSGRLTTAELQARAAGWRPWRSYAALHLWASDPTDKRGAKETPNETVVRSYVIADRNSAVRV